MSPRFWAQNPRMKVRCLFLSVVAAVWMLAPASRAAGFDIGATAPEITGKDLDGKVMKLSEFRGKVVVLDFWGFW
jgi:AhpC/TSA family